MQSCTIAIEHILKRIENAYQEHQDHQKTFNNTFCNKKFVYCMIKDKKLTYIHMEVCNMSRVVYTEVHLIN